MSLLNSKAALAGLKFVVSAGLLTALLRQTDLDTLVAQFRQMKIAWGVAALGTYALVLGVSAWRWHLLLRAQTVHVGYGRLTQSFLVATFFNNFLPSNIGGDVVRVADTARHAGSKTLATTVVLIDRVLGLAALLAVGTIAATVAVWSGIRLAGVHYVWAALVAVLAGLIVVLRHSDRLARFAQRGPWAKTDGVQRRLEHLRQALVRFAEQPVSLWGAFAGALLVQALLIGFYVCAAYSLAVPFPLWAAAVIVPVSLAAQMVPLSINGFGVREAVFAFFFTSLGLDVTSALVLSLGSAGLIMIFSLSGGVVFLLRSRPPLALPRPAAS
jgi:glycosyltransferase 2 family protein